MKERLKHVIEREFKPEFIGRIDEIVVFRKLTRDDLKKIVDIELSKVCNRLAERGLKLELTDEAREFIIDKGGDTDYGARPLRRSVSTYIEDPLSEELLRGALRGQDPHSRHGQGSRRPEAARLRRHRRKRRRTCGSRHRQGVDPAQRFVNSSDSIFAKNPGPNAWVLLFRNHRPLEATAAKSRLGIFVQRPPGLG